ncbi:MAG: helix-turn-helix domain-containing protein [Nitrospirota bacterium]
MELSSGVKFRCYPTEEQQKILSQWMGCQRFIYNAKVSEDRYFRTFRNHSLSLTGIQTPVDQQYAQFKSNERCSCVAEFQESKRSVSCG